MARETRPMRRNVVRQFLLVATMPQMRVAVLNEQQMRTRR